MTYLRVRNMTRNIDLGQRIRVASSLRDRTVGLLSTSALDSGEGLWLCPCKSIHTFFMRFPIDVLFLDEKGTVLNANTYKPWRISALYAKSRGVLELAAGSVDRTGTQVGDHLEMKEHP